MGDAGDLTTVKQKSSKSSDSDSSSCWQLEINSMSIADKWNHMFENQLYTDTRLLIGDTLEAVECHKVVLILNSPVFESMLSTRRSKSTLLATTETKEEIHLPNDDPSAIKLLLSHFYDGHTVTEDEALDLLLASKKYICPHVTNMCLQLLKSSTNERNVIPIFQEAYLADEPELLKQAEIAILNQAYQLVGLQEFSKFKLEHLKYFLEHDELNVDELDLFNAVYKWGQVECKRQNLDSTKCENISEVLKDILPLVRFHCMDLEDFTVHVVSKKVLPLEQTVEVYRFLTTPPDMLNKEAEKTGADLNEEANKEEPSSESHFQLNATEARSRKLYTFKSLEDCRISSEYPYSGKEWYSFCCKTNQDIKLVSLGFYRAIRPEEEVHVSLRILDKEMNRIFSELTTTTTCSLDADVFHVSFPKPVRITKDVFYTIYYQIRWQETLYEVMEPLRYALYCVPDFKITFWFKEAKAGTDMLQVPEIRFLL